MDLKSLFGTDALTYEQFAEKAKDLKLVDLNEGEYVAKGKYDKADNALKEAKKTIEQLEANKGNTDNDFSRYIPAALLLFRNFDRETRCRFSKIVFLPFSPPQGIFYRYFTSFVIKMQ